MSPASKLRSALRKRGWVLTERPAVAPGVHPTEIERWQSPDEGTYAYLSAIGHERLWRVTIDWQDQRVPSTLPSQPGWPVPDPQGWLTAEQALAALPPIPAKAPGPRAKPGPPVKGPDGQKLTERLIVWLAPSQAAGLRRIWGPTGWPDRIRALLEEEVRRADAETPDSLDELIAEGEAKWPGFEAKVAEAVDRRAKSRMTQARRVAAGLPVDVRLDVEPVPEPPPPLRERIVRALVTMGSAGISARKLAIVVGEPVRDRVQGVLHELAEGGAVRREGERGRFCRWVWSAST